MKPSSEVTQKIPEQTFQALKKNIKNRISVPLLQNIEQSFIDYYERLIHQVQKQSIQMKKWLQQWKIKAFFSNYGLQIKDQVIEDMGKIINNCKELPCRNWTEIYEALEQLDRFQTQQLKKNKYPQKNLQFTEIPKSQVIQLQNHIKQLKIKRYQFPQHQFTISQNIKNQKKNVVQSSKKVQQKNYIYFKIVELIGKINVNVDLAFWKCRIANDQYKQAEVCYQSWIRLNTTILCTDFQQFKDSISGKTFIRCYKVKNSESQLFSCDSQSQTQIQQINYQQTIEKIQQQQIQIQDKYPTNSIKYDDLENKLMYFQVSHCQQVDMQYQCILINKKDQTKMQALLPMISFICNKALVYIINPSLIHYKGQYRIEIARQTQIYEGFNKLFHCIDKKYRTISQLVQGDRRFNLRVKINNITATKSEKKLFMIEDSTASMPVLAIIPISCKNGDIIQMFGCAVIANTYQNIFKGKNMIILQHSGKIIKMI